MPACHVFSSRKPFRIAGKRWDSSVAPNPPQPFLRFRLGLQCSTQNTGVAAWQNGQAQGLPLSPGHLNGWDQVRVGKDMLLWPLTRPYRAQHLTLGHMVSVIADILRGPGCPPRQVNAPLKHSVFHLPIFHATRIGESIFALHRALHLRRSERVNASFSPCLACQGAQLSCGSCLSLAWFAADWIGSLTSSTSGL